MSMKLFKIEMKHYEGDVYVVAEGYDEAVEKALEIRCSPEYENTEDDIMDGDEEEKEREEIKKKKKAFKVRTVELLTENLQGISDLFLMKPIIKKKK